MRVLVVSGSTAKLPDPVYPLGAAIVGTAARRAGHEVSYFDALHHRDPLPVFEEIIRTTSPEVFLFSLRNIDSGAFPNPEIYFENHKPLTTLARKLSDAPLILGGSAFSLMPEAFLSHLDADFGVVGDGEQAVVEVLAAIEAKKKVNRITRGTPIRGDFLQADRDLFDADWYYTYGGVANIQTKRGCPLKCIYCTYPSLEGRKTRQSSPKRVVDELETLIGQGIRDFFFVDAVFNRPESHAAMVCEEIIRRNLDLSFTGYFTPMGDLKEFPDLLKRAGCNAAEFGTDSLSDAVLTKLKKGFGAAEAMSYCARFEKVGIPQCHNLILGAPGETEETMEESLRRMHELNPRAVIVTIGLRVYPGTELARLGLEDDESGSLRGDSLDPVFYLEPTVADTVVDKAAFWVDEHKGWICPGLGKKYNARYLARQRMRRGHKGVLWTLF